MFLDARQSLMVDDLQCKTPFEILSLRLPTLEFDAKDQGMYKLNIVKTLTHPHANLRGIIKKRKIGKLPIR